MWLFLAYFSISVKNMSQILHPLENKAYIYINRCHAWNSVNHGFRLIFNMHSWEICGDIQKLFYNAKLKPWIVITTNYHYCMSFPKCRMQILYGLHLGSDGNVSITISKWRLWEGKINEIVFEMIFLWVAPIDKRQKATYK